MTVRDLTRALAISALLCGVFVVFSEVPFWGRRSSLWPVLTAIGLAVVALAAAQLLERR